MVKSKFRQLLASLLSAIILVSALPIQTLSAEWGKGDEVYAAMLGDYIGSDGKGYSDQCNYPYLIYTNVKDKYDYGYRYASSHAKLGVSKNGIVQQAICIEAGVDYSTGSGYVGEGSSSSDYIGKLSDDAQVMLKLALLCGFNSDTTSSPVSGTNLDDFSFATQVIAWEIQQQLRTGYNKGDLKSNSAGTPAKVFYEQLQNRPAEKCYDYILSKMKAYKTVPSFTATNKAYAPTHELKYNASTGKWSTTIPDDDESGMPASAFNISGVTVTKSGNNYTFTTSTKITGTKTCSYKANRTTGDSLVVWKSKEGQQTMAAGIDDPVQFFVKFTTENTGTAQIKKTWVHNGNQTATNSDIYFTMKNSSGTTVKATGSAGSYTYSTSGTVTKFKLNSSNTFSVKDLPAGNYTVTEYSSASDYTCSDSSKTVTVPTGGTGTVTFKNTRDTGTAQIKKVWAHNGEQTATNSNIYFTIKNSSGTTVKATGSAGSYTYSTSGTVTKFMLNSSNTFSVSKLPTGTYTVTEHSSSSDYTCSNASQTVKVTSGATGTVTFTNTRNTGTGTVIKTWSGKNFTSSETTTLNASVTFYIKDNSSNKFVTATGSAGSYTYSGLVTAPPQMFSLNTSTGKFTMTNMPTGSYTVYEYSKPSGYTPNKESQTFTISKGATSTITFNNVMDTGTGKITKKWVAPTTLSASEIAELEANVYFTVKDSKGNNVLASGSAGEYSFVMTSEGGTTKYRLSNSTFSISGLPVGKYTVTEYCSADGYNGYDAATDTEPVQQSQTITVSKGKTSSVTFTNKSVPLLIVRKHLSDESNLTDEQLKAEYAKITFKIMCLGTDGSETSTSAPHGFFVSATGSDGVYTGTEITSGAGTTFSLDENGYAQVDMSFNGVAPLYYKVIEYYDGTEYALDSESKIFVFATGNPDILLGIDNVVFNNTLKPGNLEAIKTFVGPDGTAVTASAEQIADITFKIKNSDGKYLTFTGSNGVYTYSAVDETGTGTALKLSSDAKLSVSGLPSRQTYSIIETEGTEGYDFSEEPVTFEILPNETTSDIEFVNTAMSGSIEIQKRSEDNILAGWKFRVKLIESVFDGYTYDEIFTTDANGLINIDNLRIGKYEISEITDDVVGYFTPDSQVVEVKTDEKTTSEMENHPKGSVHVTKIDKDYPDNKLTGATFTVYASDKTTVIGELTEITTGEYQLDDILFGDYYLKETVAPENYVLDDTFYPFSIEEAGATVNVETKAGKGLENDAQTGSIKIQKRSSDNVLSGWKFRVQLVNSTFKDYTYDKTFTTDANGVIEIDDIRIGTYSVTEVKDNKTVGYITDKSKSVTIESDELSEVTYANSPYGHIVINKTDSKTGDKVTGATFGIYSDAECLNPAKAYKSDTDRTLVDAVINETETGKYTCNYLPIKSASGTTYYIKELTAPAGYYLDPNVHAVTLTTANATVPVSNVTDSDKFTENPYGNARITKEWVLDNGTNNLTADELAAYKAQLESSLYFTIKNSDGKYITATGSNGVYKYTSESAAEFKFSLKNGTFYVSEIPTGVYTVEEHSSLGDYTIQSDNPVTITVTINQTAQARFVNERDTGDAEISKNWVNPDGLTAAQITELESNIKFTVTNGDGEYLKVSAVTDGKYTYNGTQADKAYFMLTDSKFAIAELPTGTYTITEYNNAEGYLPVTQSKTITVTKGQTATAGFVNEVIVGSINLIKVDADNTEQKISGAKFTVYNDVNGNGTYEEDIDSEYKDLTDNGDGTYSLDKVTYGKYLVKEISVPDGYVIDDNYYPVFIDSKDVVKVVSNSEDGLFHEQPVKGSVEVIKVDEDYPDNKLSGAEFTVYASDKTTVIGTLSEVEDGVYRLDGLRYGEYYLKETKAPEYYVLDENYYYFQIVNDGEKVFVGNTGFGEGVFINSPQKGALKIVKTSANGRVAGFTFLIKGRTYTGQDYEERFVTDETGIILIENLRAGEYTVHEVHNAASVGYILPADQTIVIENDDLKTLNVFNDIPDIPETGAFPELPITIVGIGLGVAAIAFVLILMLRKRK